FYLASAAFPGRLRLDLVLLYSFCRVADDLIDNAENVAEAKQWVATLRTYLDLCYGGSVKTADGREISARDPNQGPATQHVMQSFPPATHLTLLLLPTHLLAKEPLYELLQGFEMDLRFTPAAPCGPIKSEQDLDTYGARVAGTVALLCIQLVLHHYPPPNTSGDAEARAERLMRAGHAMGVAL
ncbi:hypothetical protein LTR53_018817, partial [Teratosphaeriaceae sp. CCFEE 6253]